MGHLCSDLRVWKGSRNLWQRHQSSLNVSGPWINAVKGTHVQVISRFPSRSWAVCWDQERRCSQCGCALEAGSALQMKSWIHRHGCAEGLEGLPWNWREECLLREKLSDWEKGEGERLTSHCRSFFFFFFLNFVPWVLITKELLTQSQVDKQTELWTLRRQFQWI